MHNLHLATKLSLYQNHLVQFQHYSHTMLPVHHLILHFSITCGQDFQIPQHKHSPRTWLCLHKYYKQGWRQEVTLQSPKAKRENRILNDY